MDTIDHIRKLPGLEAEDLHIWGVHVPDIKNQLARLYELLSKKEQAKANRFRRKQDRASSIAARGALRVLLSGYTGVPASDIRFSYSEHGKPYGEGLDVNFNVSHSGVWVVLGLGRDRCIGVDVEKIKWDLDVNAVAERYFPSNEVVKIRHAATPQGEFFKLWTRKEAFVKARGSTLFQELGTDVAVQEGWYTCRLEAGSKYAAAVVTDKKVTRMPCYAFSPLQWEP